MERTCTVQALPGSGFGDCFGAADEQGKQIGWIRATLPDLLSQLGSNSHRLPRLTLIDKSEHVFQRESLQMVVYQYDARLRLLNVKVVGPLEMRAEHSAQDITHNIQQFWKAHPDEIWESHDEWLKFMGYSPLSRWIRIRCTQVVDKGDEGLAYEVNKPLIAALAGGGLLILGALAGYLGRHRVANWVARPAGI